MCIAKGKTWAMPSLSHIIKTAVIVDKINTCHHQTELSFSQKNRSHGNSHVCEHIMFTLDPSIGIYLNADVRLKSTTSNVALMFRNTGIKEICFSP